MYARFALAFSAPVAALITAATSLAYAGSLTWEVLPLTANGVLPIATVAIDTDSESSGPTHSPRTAAFCTWDWYVAESSAFGRILKPTASRSYWTMLRMDIAVGLLPLATSGTTGRLLPTAASSLLAFAGSWPKWVLLVVFCLGLVF